MAILVTGGAGFIGSHLVGHLLSAGYESVVILDNFCNFYDPAIKHANAGLYAEDERVVTVDGSYCDLSLMERLFENHRFSHVVHLGGYPGVPASLKAPLAYIEANITGTVTLLEVARQFPLQRFLFASSSTVYGRGARAPFQEDAPLGSPLSPYGATKRAGEILGQTYLNLYDVPFVSLRFFNVYGPRLRPELALAAFARKILSRQPLTLYGDGSAQRDFTHVSDVCRGILAALRAPGIVGQAINLGHQEPVTVKQLIALLEKTTGLSAIIDQQPARMEDMPLTCADLQKAQRLLGYSPQVSIEQGVEEYVAWLRETL